MKRPAGVSLDSISKHYTTPSGAVRAVDGITLELEAGSSLAITGPSGCGKSTLLGLIAGLEAPTAGRVVVGGEEISSLSDRRRARLRRDPVGLVFQRDNLLPFLTAVENVALQGALAGGSKRPERYLEVLAELGLGNEAGRIPDQLSGGQRQRVAVARAVVNRPGVILADEPTGSLDDAGSAAVMELLLATHRQAGATLVVVTHDLDVALRLDATISLRDGRLEEHGARREALQRRSGGA